MAADLASVGVTSHSFQPSQQPSPPPSCQPTRFVLKAQDQVKAGLVESEICTVARMPSGARNATAYFQRVVQSWVKEESLLLCW